MVTVHDWEDGRYANPRACSPEEIESLITLKQPTEQFQPYHEREIARMTWYCLGKRRPISVHKSNRKTYEHPNLVFKVRERKLMVAMIKAHRRPKLTDKVYLAPYQGTDVHGDMMGHCQVRLPTDEKNIEEWEKVFFCSTFNKVPRPFFRIGEKEQVISTLEEWIYGDI